MEHPPPDTSRDGSGRLTKADVAIDMDTGPTSIADEAKADRAMGRPTSGTRGYADTEAFDRDR